MVGRSDDSALSNDERYPIDERKRRRVPDILNLGVSSESIRLDFT